MTSDQSDIEQMIINIIKDRLEIRITKECSYSCGPGDLELEVTLILDEKPISYNSVYISN